MPKTKSSDKTTDKMGNAFFSIYYHCEVSAAAHGKTYTDENGQPLDPTALPTKYKILPLPRALAAFKANIPSEPADFERFVALVRFTIPILARSFENIKNVIGVDDVVGMTTFYTQQVQVLARRRVASAPRILVNPDLPDQIRQILVRPLQPGPVNQRFANAFAVVNGGKPLGAYSFTPTYQAIVTR